MVYPANKALIKKILSDAEEEAKRIIDISKTKAEEIIKSKIKEAESKANEEAKLIIEEAEEKAKRITSTLISSAKIRANWNFLSERKKLIDETFERLKDELKDFTRTPKYKEFLQSLIEKSVMIAGGEEELEVMLNEEDLEKISLEEISKRINDKLGKNIKLIKSTSSIDTIGGVIVKSKDGKILINNTFESIIRIKRKDLEPIISHILFGS
jgi:V/A-type H+-transporting ATPase subunit E